MSTENPNIQFVDFDQFSDFYQIKTNSNEHIKMMLENRLFNIDTNMMEIEEAKDEETSHIIYADNNYESSGCDSQKENSCCLDLADLMLNTSQYNSDNSFYSENFNPSLDISQSVNSSFNCVDNSSTNICSQSFTHGNIENNSYLMGFSQESFNFISKKSDGNINKNLNFKKLSNNNEIVKSKEGSLYNVFTVQQQNKKLKKKPSSFIRINSKLINNDKSIDSKQSEDKELIKSFKCLEPKCTKTYKSKENLTLHIKNFHLKEKPYSCSYCDSTFSHRNGKTYHERKFHTKYLPYKCITLSK